MSCSEGYDKIVKFINIKFSYIDMSNKCKRCGADSGKFDLCKDCWVEIQNKLDENINNYKCKLCGSYSGGYSLCWDCRNDFDNGTYIPCIKCGKFKKNDKKLCKKCEEKDKSENMDIIRKKQSELQSDESRDYRKKYPAKYRTTDGHYVRSRGEVMIANFLFRNKIRFIYEKRVCKDGEEYYPDFFLVDQGIYVEYWGSEDKDYVNTKNKKKDFYRKNKLVLIEIDNKDIENLEDQLERKLEEKGISFDWQ